MTADNHNEIVLKKQEPIMNHPTQLHPYHHGRHWPKDLQFAAGVMVAVAGAAVLLSEIAGLFA